MRTLLGIDIGTSSTKAVLIDLSGKLLARSQSEYPIDSPKPGWAEQHPETWWTAVKETVRAVLSQSGANPLGIAGIGLSGQMHGTVLLDKNKRLLRPAVIWADRRSRKQCDAVQELLGKERLRDLAGNSLSPGFMAATLLWLKENEPEVFSQIATVFLPKDYVRFKLTGEYATEVSDASGTSLFNVPQRRWSELILERIDLPAEFFRPY